MACISMESCMAAQNVDMHLIRFTRSVIKFFAE